MRIILLLLALCLASCAGVQSRYHQVVSGESLVQIANHYNVPVNALKKYNSDILQGGLQAGDKIYIPYENNPDWNIEFTEEGRKLASADAPMPDVNHVHFNWPVTGYISSGFGRRHNRDHEGIDIPAVSGTPVHASRSGHVIYAGNQIRGYGNMVIVRHPDSFSTVYAHLSKIDVKKGQFVSRGQTVGKVGHTGHAHGSHLHFEIRDHRAPVNPLFYLQGQYANHIVGR